MEENLQRDRQENILLFLKLFVALAFSFWLGENLGPPLGVILFLPFIEPLRLQIVLLGLLLGTFALWGEKNYRLIQSFVLSFLVYSYLLHSLIEKFLNLYFFPFFVYLLPSYLFRPRIFALLLFVISFFTLILLAKKLTSIKKEKIADLFSNVVTILISLYLMGLSLFATYNVYYFSPAINEGDIFYFFNLVFYPAIALLFWRLVSFVFQKFAR